MDEKNIMRDNMDVVAGNASIAQQTSGQIPSIVEQDPNAAKENTDYDDEYYGEENY